MSTPRNHHYVSQVLSQNFFDENNEAHIYDKTAKYFAKIKSTKTLFSQKDLNSILNEGEIDHSSTEKELNKNFETDFKLHYEKVISIIENPSEFSSQELNESIKYLIGMGIIGEMRTPQHMKNMEATIFGNLFMIAENATEELRTSIEAAYYNRLQVTNKLPIDFKDICDSVFELMGDITYSIHKAPQDIFFILPDCTSSATRMQLEDDAVIDGEVYSNPQRPISMVLMPINSKILIGAHASKIIPGNNNGIYSLNNEAVTRFNNILYKCANERVVCENESYLRKFIERYSI